MRNIIIILFILLIIDAKFSKCEKENFLLKVSNPINTKCINEIFKRNEIIYTTLIITNSIFKNTLFYNYGTQFLLLSVEHSFEVVKKIQCKFFIFRILDLNDLIISLKKLRQYFTFSTRHNFIIHLEEKNYNIQNVFILLWEYYIYNVIVFKASNDSYNLLTYYPFDGHACGRSTIEKVLGTCKDNLDNYYPPKIPMDFEGCSFSAITMIRAPFVININSTSYDNPSVQGYEHTILMNIVKKMNFSLVHFKHDFQDWGAKLSNGSYTEMFSVLYNKKTDFMYCAMYSNDSYDDDLDFSMPYIFTRNYWWVPAAIEIPAWKNLLMIFNFKLILLIVAFIIIYSLIWWIFDTENNNFIYCMLNTWSMMMLVSAPFPKILPLKLQFFIWSACSLILSNLFFSQLLSVLNHPIFEHQISSVDEILSTGLKFGFHPGYEPDYDIQMPRDRYILQNYITCTSGLECPNRTAFKRDFALMKSETQTKYMMSKIWTRKDGKNLLYPIYEYSSKNLNGYNF